MSNVREPLREFSTDLLTTSQSLRSYPCASPRRCAPTNSKLSGAAFFAASVSNAMLGLLTPVQDQGGTAERY